MSGYVTTSILRLFIPFFSRWWMDALNLTCSTKENCAKIRNITRAWQQFQQACRRPGCITMPQSVHEAQHIAPKSRNVQQNLQTFKSSNLVKKQGGVYIGQTNLKNILCKIFGVKLSKWVRNDKIWMAWHRNAFRINGPSCGVHWSPVDT